MPDSAPTTPAGNSTAPAMGAETGGRRRRAGVSLKALKRTLKAAGKKTSGKKATLKARVKKFKLKV